MEGRDQLGRLTASNPWAFKKGHKSTSTFLKGNKYGELRKGIRTRAKEIAWEENENGCWVCTSHVPNTYGYPQCRINYKFKMISHIMYEKFKGEITTGMLICHTCDNPTCINPEHLFLGTNLDNMADMVKKGRQSHIGSPGLNGEKHPRAKLTEVQVTEILSIKGMRNKEIAHKFNISQERVSSIRTGQSWKYLQRGVN